MVTNPQPLGAEDLGAHEAVLAHVRQRLMSYVRRRYPHLVEDITQECMLLLHRRYAHVTEAEDLVRIGITIAKHKLQEELRRAAREALPMQDGFDAADTRQKSGEQLLVERAAVERLQGCIRQLGPDCRQLLQLMLQGKRTDEICGLLHIKSGTLHTRLCRCRKRLAGAMGWAG